MACLRDQGRVYTLNNPARNFNVLQFDEETLQTQTNENS